MAEIKVKVPEGMLKAAYNSEGNLNLKGNLPLMGELRINQILEAALRWLSENPIVPTYEQIVAIHDTANPTAQPATGKHWETRNWLVEWQRRMFLSPEPEAPEAIRDLLSPKFFNALQIATGSVDDGKYSRDEYEKSVIEAYRRGKESKEVPEVIESFPEYLFFEKHRSDLWADEVNAKLKLAWTEAYRRGQRNPK